MSEQYFEKNPNAQHELKEIFYEENSLQLSFTTDSGTFSKNRVDYGSKVLIKSLVQNRKFKGSEKLLELGSGYGPIAIVLGKTYPSISVKGIEINERAYALSLINRDKNKAANVSFIHHDVQDLSLDESFDLILTNPPIRAGKATIQKFIDIAEQHLKTDGELWVVIQKKQGAPSMQTYMESVFSNVEKVSQDKGYWILKSIKA